jgi:hypothetical protein
MSFLRFSSNITPRIFFAKVFPPVRRNGGP